MAQRRKKRDTQPQRQWQRIDLHLHTPASSDFQDPHVSYLDVLQKAEARGLDIIAFTDHNSVAGYAAMLQEIEQLELLERLKRILPDERKRLDEYRRLRKNILVLPGFEFTATFGFHIIGVFAETTPVREIEHILLDLNVPAEKLDQGATDCGATADVLTAYRLIDEAGGLVIAAHVNSSNGVAMRGLGFGGQTKIAYTQDDHLHVLEVTDLDTRGKRNSTAAFFNGSKPEYPRRMHCIQGSDAHRLNRDPNSAKQLGVGDRVTEVLLPTASFEALRDLFFGNDFTLTRPYSPKQEPFDVVRAAREEGASIVQAFHEGYSKRGGKQHAILADICAFANTNGGTLYIGVPDDPHKPAQGVTNPKQVLSSLEKAIQTSITPAIDVTFTTHESNKVKIVQVNVPRGPDVPYAIDDNKIYVRSEAETNLAVRDEIVQIIQRRALASGELQAVTSEEVPITTNGQLAPPRTGVEIVASTVRDGTTYHTMRDLRNNNLVHNVTRKSARKLWHYAITEHEKQPAAAGNITWLGDLGLLSTSKRAGVIRYDLVQRQPDGQLRVYYGVTDDGIHGDWRKVIELSA
jgi:histidinol phosphatase-like PHP family hydrolase